MGVCLVTGANGFLGKVVLHRLLARAESLGVERIAIILRPRGGLEAEQRFVDEILSSPIFAGRVEELRQRITVLSGKLSHPGCALSPEGREFLVRSATHVIHCAASVRFDSPLPLAVQSNVDTVMTLLQLALDLPLLRHFVHTSTAYVMPNTEEGSLLDCPAELPKLPEAPQALLEAIREETLSEETMFNAGFPNSYTFTKAIAEHLFHEASTRFVRSIVRPSIISCGFLHPMPGWTDSENAHGAHLLAMERGLVPVALCARDARPNIVACDFVADRLIDVGFSRREVSEDASPQIFYATADHDLSLTMRETARTVFDVFRHNLPGKIRFRPILLSNERVFRVVLWFLDALPRWWRIRLLEKQGRKPEARRLRLLGSAPQHLLRQFRYFVTRNFRFADHMPFQFGPAGNARLYHALTAYGIQDYLVGKNFSGMVCIAGKRYRGYFSDRRLCFGNRHWSWFHRCLCWLMAKTCRQIFDSVRVNYAGLVAALQHAPAGTKLVFTPTHKSYFDFLLMYFLFFIRSELGIHGLRTAATTKFRKTPLYAYLMRSGGVFFVEREPSRQDVLSLKRKVQDAAQALYPLMFFPEGRRSRTGRLLPLKRGLFRYLKETGENFSIIPISICYTRRADEESLQREAKGERVAERSLQSGFGWVLRALKGRISLGEVIIDAALPFALDSKTDLAAAEKYVSDNFAAMEQKNMPQILQDSSPLPPKERSPKIQKARLRVRNKLSKTQIGVDY